jgi:hypothetical protein
VDPTEAAELPPFVIEAKDEIFSSTLRLPQTGQTTSDVSPALRTSFSKTAPHWEQSNS